MRLWYAKQSSVISGGLNVLCPKPIFVCAEYLQTGVLLGVNSYIGGVRKIDNLIDNFEMRVP